MNATYIKSMLTVAPPVSTAAIAAPPVAIPAKAGISIHNELETQDSCLRTLLSGTIQGAVLKYFNLLTFNKIILLILKNQLMYKKLLGKTRQTRLNPSMDRSGAASMRLKVWLSFPRIAFQIPSRCLFFLKNYLFRTVVCLRRNG